MFFTDMLKVLAWAFIENKWGEKNITIFSEEAMILQFINYMIDSLYWRK